MSHVSSAECKMRPNNAARLRSIQHLHDHLLSTRYVTETDLTSGHHVAWRCISWMANLHRRDDLATYFNSLGYASVCTGL